MGELIYDEQWKDLATAVVGQAVSDCFEYKYRAEHCKSEIKREWYRYELQKVEEFFLSERFSLFTDADGRAILDRIKRMPTKQPRRGRGSNKHVW